MFRVAVGGRLGGVSVERASAVAPRAVTFSLGPWPIACKGLVDVEET